MSIFLSGVIPFNIARYAKKRLTPNLEWWTYSSGDASNSVIQHNYHDGNLNLTNGHCKMLCRIDTEQLKRYVIINSSIVANQNHMTIGSSSDKWWGIYFHLLTIFACVMPSARFLSLILVNVETLHLVIEIEIGFWGEHHQINLREGQMFDWVCELMNRWLYGIPFQDP
jgi:hypothetical protein